MKNEQPFLLRWRCIMACCPPPLVGCAQRPARGPKGEEEGKPRTKHTSPEDAQIVSHHTDGLMSQLVSLSQALAQHIQEGFPVLAAKRGDWRCSTLQKNTLWMERGWWCYKNKNDPDLELVLAWEQVRETEVRSWLAQMPWRAQGVKSLLSSPEARTREPCLLASERDAKKRSSLWHLYSSEHS